VRFFIAGIMQGSRRDPDIYSQDYRTDVRELILHKYPQAQVVCPYELYPESPYYDAEKGKETFLDLTNRAQEVDYLVAYLPQASMGSAIEMWQAYRAGIPILSISPMTDNWVVKFLSARVFATMGEFAEFIASDGLDNVSPAE
jgi:hypothetical protein